MQSPRRLSGEPLRGPRVGLFLSKCCPEPNTGCTIWLGWTNSDGYGIFGNGRFGSAVAHRWAYENIARRTVPEGYVVHHKCHNRWCVNVDHLEAIPRLENVALGDAPGWRIHRTGACARGHKLLDHGKVIDGRLRCALCWRRMGRVRSRRHKDLQGRKRLIRECKPIAVNEETLASFEARYVPEPNTGCWIWTGVLNRQYGQFRAGAERDEMNRRKTVLAHRFAYEAFVDKIPRGLEIDHLCRNRWCVNPRHLEPVTNIVNAFRRRLAD